MLRKLAGFLAVFATLALAGCGYNDLQRQDEGIKAAWSEVLNQYQRRADLVPNLVNTVKGYAAQEEKVLIEVTNARAGVGAIKATPELVNDPAAFQKFIKAQGELTGAGCAAGAGCVAGAGAAAGLLKSTFGGALTAASFSTVKLGLTSILNTIAVRLVGNWRTVVLNSWTVLM